MYVPQEERQVKTPRVDVAAEGPPEGRDARCLSGGGQEEEGRNVVGDNSGAQSFWQDALFYCPRVLVRGANVAPSPTDPDFEAPGVEAENVEQIGQTAIGRLEIWGKPIDLRKSILVHPKAVLPVQGTVPEYASAGPLKALCGRALRAP